eukprot:8006075-Pyramimonas_sp.AAC.4
MTELKSPVSEWLNKCGSGSWDTMEPYPRNEGDRISTDFLSQTPVLEYQRVRGIALYGTPEQTGSILTPGLEEIKGVPLRVAAAVTILRAFVS